MLILEWRVEVGRSECAEMAVSREDNEHAHATKGCGNTRRLPEVDHVTPARSFENNGEASRTIDAQREANGDQGIGSAVERAISDQELAELALEWMMNPQSSRVPNVSQIR